MAIKVVEGRDYRILPDDYRAIFHKHNKPVKVEKKIIKGQVVQMRYYRCLYCGKLVSHIDMQVDHIIPKTRFMAGILWNPNRAWNLGPSCPHCNSSKSNYVDSRVIKGFQNKLINKYGLTRKFADWRGKDLDLAEETKAGDSESLQKIMPFIMALVYALMILKPVIIVLSWLIQAAMFVTVRLLKILKKLGSRFSRWAIKRAKKSLKYYIAHPNKLYILAGKVALISFCLYFLGFGIFGPSTFLANISTIGGTIWAWGSGLFEKIFSLFK